ncbi:hypothetical protein BX661DRAFT_177168 [Kickxella alabastrina]|uniref:uncharacterized protein n=1 Tax=Kickxella alabastrina TaxID=61397 RepID=UPI00221EAC0D|nr:uncharacterized protein BX661DRAFT_177168 [Kickxella alabastrina]KAI7833591.1 hypothetical protein BX661DRAFT_177168 [Kickxella alabastrina]
MFKLGWANVLSGILNSILSGILISLRISLRISVLITSLAASLVVPQPMTLAQPQSMTYTLSFLMHTFPAEISLCRTPVSFAWARHRVSCLTKLGTSLRTRPLTGRSIP